MGYRNAVCKRESKREGAREAWWERRRDSVGVVKECVGGKLKGRNGKKRGTKENLKHIAQSDIGFFLVKWNRGVNHTPLVLARSKMVKGREADREQ